MIFTPTLLHHDTINLIASSDGGLPSGFFGNTYDLYECPLGHVNVARLLPSNFEIVPRMCIVSVSFRPNRRIAPRVGHGARLRLDDTVQYVVYDGTARERR